jgi:hypothetical protein
MPLQATISSSSNYRNRILSCAATAISAVDSRLVGKNNTVNWNTISGSPNSLIDSLSARRNPLVWGSDLMHQLNCAVVYKTSWKQSIGGVAITPRHLLLCGHVKDNFLNLDCRFLNDSGEYPVEVETRKIIKTYAVAGQNPMVFEGNFYDLRVFLLDQDVPSWVYICPIVTIRSEFLNKIDSPPLTIPYIHITQGYGSGSPAQFQRMSVLQRGPHYTLGSIREPFYHFAYTGDSGTPTFLCIKGNIYLAGIVTTTGGGQQSVMGESQVRYINELIRLADVEAGINTGYTVNSIDMSEIN